MLQPDDAELLREAPELVRVTRRLLDALPASNAAPLRILRGLGDASAEPDACAED